MANPLSGGDLRKWLRASFWHRGLARGLERPRVRVSGHELRLSGDLFRRVRDHIEDRHRGEEAGFLFCGHSRVDDREVLLGREWTPVPETDKVRRGRYGLEWTASFSARVLARADALQAGVVLIHSHGRTSRPLLSEDDRDTAERLLTGFSRLLGCTCGSVVLGDSVAAGSFFHDGSHVGDLSLIRVVDVPLAFWLPTVAVHPTRVRRRLDRQSRAIGPTADARLAASSVAVIGVCGGGSHVCQQLAHQGVGRIVPIDDQLIEEVNLGRMVGARRSDIGRVPKTAAMRRLVQEIDPEIVVDEVRDKFPDGHTILGMKSADLVISCVDSFLVREQINAFCRRHHLPLIDMGMNIKTRDGKLEAANGQMVLVLPDSSCLRCTSLLSDAVLDREMQERPPGYDRNPDALGEPQVVSMNGALASEACNSALDLLTGYADGARGANWWGYDGRRGEITRYELPKRRRGCPACAEQAHGDPRS